MSKNADYARRLATAINCLDGIYARGAAGNGVKPGVLDLLYILDDSGANTVHTQKSISEEWVLPYTTVNTITKACEADGYVEQIPIPGKRREKQIVMTEKCKAFVKETLDNVYKAESAAIRKTLKECDPAFIEAMEAYTRNLKEAFDKYVNDEAHKCCKSGDGAAK